MKNILATAALMLALATTLGCGPSQKEIDQDWQRIQNEEDQNLAHTKAQIACADLERTLLKEHNSQRQIEKELKHCGCWKTLGRD
jgi:hypothetical protein